MRKHLSTNDLSVGISSTSKRSQDSNDSQNQQQQLIQQTTTGICAPLPQSSTSKSVQSKMTVFLPKKKKKMSLCANKTITEKLLLLFIKDFQPFSIVEDEGFKQFIKALNPAYELPNRKTISRTLVPALYEEQYQKCRNVATDIKSVCLTTDCWTSENTESYVAVTAHYLNKNFEFQHFLLDYAVMRRQHTSLNLASEISRIVTEWNLQDKVLLVVTDNASNIKNAITNLNWNHFGCFAHTINLIVKEALANDNDLLCCKKLKQLLDISREATIQMRN